MRILYIIDSLVPGGAERSLAGMTSHMVAAGVDLHVVPLIDRAGVQRELLSAGAVVHPAVGAVRIGAVPVLRRLIRATKPDLVHTTLFEADVAGRLAARSARKPSVTSLVNTSYLTPTDATTVARAKLGAALATDLVTARFAVRFHAVSQAVAATMIRRLRIPAEKVDVIPRGRDVEAIGRRGAERRARVRLALGIDQQRKIVLAIARHDPRKGLDVLVRAWPDVLRSDPGAVLLVAGREGPATASLQTTIAAVGVAPSVRLLGHRDDVADVMAAADVVALCSRAEGLPGSLLEAMAIEVPVVATDIEPVREVVGESGGPLTLVPVGDVAALGTALERTLSKPPAAEVLSDGRALVERSFSVGASVSKMIAFYERSLGDAGTMRRAEP